MRLQKKNSTETKKKNIIKTENKRSHTDLAYKKNLVLVLEAQTF